MKSRFYFPVFLFLFSLSLFSQNLTYEYFKEKGEVYFKFNVLNKASLNDITKIISIDKVKENVVFAYANETEYNEFLKLGLPYTILPKPSELEKVETSNNMKDRAWDVYPTYDAYVTMMNAFATAYPNICKIVDGGTTVQGRKILFAKISDNVNVREAEPQFMYSSSMHGDETTGYVLMLRLIDSLLTGYTTSQRIADMINNIEIWINPLANPDGTYRGGNSSVNGATRYNANNKDINRNFPDPEEGPYPTGAWQPETIIMMDVATNNNFTLSANFHGGAEVVNYPWDCWSRLHPDNAWWISIARRYADTCHVYSPSGYMTYLNNGITNGYAWYSVYGGRQDYFTYFKRGREITIEISDTKLVSGSQLPAHWNYNKRSLFSYIENCLYGIKGIVTDTNGRPLKAKISITGYDFDSSEVYSTGVNGFYQRMLNPGTYTLVFSADSCYSKTITGVTVANYWATVKNVQLIPMYVTPVEMGTFTAAVTPAGVKLNWVTATEMNNKGFDVERLMPGALTWEKIGFINGNGTSTEEHKYSFTDKNITLAGQYSYRLNQTDFDGTTELSNEVYVNVERPYQYQLSQNYPNPFNPSTTINYSIPVKGMVTLKVYDVLGNEVNTLVNEVKESGNYSFNFNASNLSSGVYIYKLVSGDFMDTKKFTLLK